MPAKSKAQFKFLQMIAHNKKKSSMSSNQAKEFLSKNKGKAAYSKLPEKK